jgi:hypothetical protein
VLIVGLPPCGGALAVSLFSRTSMLTSVTRQYGGVTNCVSVPVYADVIVEYSDIAQGLPEFEDNLFCFCLDVVNGDIVAAQLRHVQVVWNSGDSVERRVCQRPSNIVCWCGGNSVLATDCKRLRRVAMRRVVQRGLRESRASET